MMTTSGFPGPPGVSPLDANPVRLGLERRWRVRLADGRAGLLAQLLPEASRDEALRRRYVQDMERLRDLAAPVIAEIVAIGPLPDPRDPAAAPPWRLRLDPPGEALEALLARRGPLALDEALAVATELASALHEVHRRGATLRDSASPPRRPAGRRRPLGLLHRRGPRPGGRPLHAHGRQRGAGGLPLPRARAAPQRRGRRPRRPL